MERPEEIHRSEISPLAVESGCTVCLLSKRGGVYGSVLVEVSNDTARPAYNHETIFHICFLIVLRAM